MTLLSLARFTIYKYNLYSRWHHEMHSNCQYATYPITYSDSYIESLLAKGIHLPESLHHAVLKRRCEFLTGRYCASLCLSKLGLTHPQTLTMAKTHEPIWPEGIIGSISHCHGHAVAVATPKKTGISGLGIDIETLMDTQVSRSIQSRIISSDEEKHAYLFSSFEFYLTLVFSAKESLYKALYPSIREVLDFDAATVSGVQPQKKILKLSLTRHINKKYYKGKMMSVHYRRPLSSDDIIETLCRAE